jgi:hypothetical protein
MARATAKAKALKIEAGRILLARIAMTAAASLAILALLLLSRP